MSRFVGGGSGIVLAGAAAMLALAGCGGSANDALPLIRAPVSIKTISSGGECEEIPVRITPVELRGQANKYANTRMMVVEVPMQGPADENGAPMCNGTGETLPLAPGDWEFSAPLRSGPHSCRKEIVAEGDLQVTFIDGLEGCSGAPPAPVEGEEMMYEGEPTEAPAEAPTEEAAPAG